MKVVKRVAIVLVVVVVIAVVGAYIAIDAIARGVIDSQGSAVLGVKTNVDSVRLAVFSDGSSLSGLTIANPEGFHHPNFIEVGEASIEASLGTLLGSDIEIPSVHITGLTVDLEQIGDRMNAAEIVANVEKNTAAPDDTDDPVDFNVATLVIQDIRLKASGSIVNVAGGHLDTTIPRLELHNLGTKTDGDQLSHQLISMMLGVLMKHIAEHPIRGLSGAAVGSVASALENIPILDQTGVGRKVGDVLKGANKAVNDGLGEVGKGLQGIGEGLGGLLGPEKAADETPPSDR
ncbi:MAG: hypothetical protein QF733_00880 [Phycisphaerales bacterium]|nr:hypothetical protein [Phycisphaerales bacterium]